MIPAGMREYEIRSALLAREESDRSTLSAIGRRIGYGRAQQILGELWDEMLHEAYGVGPGRGSMGVTVDDDLPPVPKPATLRRQQCTDGGYRMVPAYSLAELKSYARAAQQRALDPLPVEGGRESVEDALAVVESFGPGVQGLNDTYARQILLAAEVRRLRHAIATARDHIDMAALRISHCKDAAVIEAAIPIPTGDPS